MSNYTQSDYERDLAIRNNAPEWAFYYSEINDSYVSQDDEANIVFVGRKEKIKTVGSAEVSAFIDLRLLYDVKKLIAQYETIEKLKGAALFIDSFIEQYENEEVRVHDNAGCGYLDVRLSEHIDFSELVSAIKELTE